MEHTNTAPVSVATYARFGPTESGYVIPTYYLSTVEGALEKANKRALKKGLIVSPISIYTENCKVSYRGKHVSSVFIRFQGEIPKIPGHVMLARIEHTVEGSLIHSIDYSRNFVEYRNAPSNCDHCHVKRKRNDTYLLEHTESGKILQIGRNCLADYLRTDIASMLKVWDILFSLGTLCTPSSESEGDGYGFSGQNVCDTEDFLAKVSAVIRQEGWTSRKAVRESTTNKLFATVDIAWKSLFSFKKSDEDVYKPNEYDFDRAKKVVTWIENLPEDVTSDYLHNLRVMASLGYVTLSNAAIMASAVQSWSKANEIELEKKKSTKVSGKYGKIGDKFEVDVIVTKVNWSIGNYGPQTLINFEIVNDGRILTWWASGHKEYMVGDSLRIRGTIKQYSVFQGFESTTVTRVSCIYVK